MQLRHQQTLHQRYGSTSGSRHGIELVLVGCILGPSTGILGAVQSLSNSRMRSRSTAARQGPHRSASRCRLLRHRLLESRLKTYRQLLDAETRGIGTVPFTPKQEAEWKARIEKEERKEVGNDNCAVDGQLPYRAEDPTFHQLRMKDFSSSIPLPLRASAEPCFGKAQLSRIFI